MTDFDSGAAGGAKYKQFIVMVSAVLAALVGVGALLVTIGWGIDNDSLKTLTIAGQPVWCSTAINFVLTVLALYCFSLPVNVASLTKNKRTFYIVGTIFASLVFLSGFLTAIETLFGLDLSLNQTLYQSSSETAGITYPGPMSPDASIAFVIVALCLMLQAWLPGISGPVQWTFLVTLMVTSLPLFGTLTGARALCTFFGCLRMSAVVSTWFLLTCLACFLYRSSTGPANILVAETPSGVVARRTSVLLLLLPLLLGLRQYISAAHIVDDPLSWALFGMGATAVVVAIVISGVKAAEAYSRPSAVVDQQSTSLTASSGTAVNLFAQAIDAEVVSGARSVKTNAAREGNARDNQSSDSKRVSVDAIDDVIARQPAEEMQGALKTGNVKQERIKKICLECDREFSHSEALCPDCKIPLARVVNKSLVGEVFADKYEIIWSIGEGAMARVYKARHKYLDQMVALKVLNAAVSSTTVGIKRFQQEAKALAAVDHPNIVAVQDFGFSANGEAFLAMEYASGRSLADHLAETKTLSPPDTVAIISQLCDALTHAHDRGIVHRDLKPSNIMCRKLGNGLWSVKVVDFGLAKMIDDENGQSALKLTQTGECHGSPPYMSPEQCMGKEVDYRTDIYALGCIIYECVTGYPPFFSGSVYDILTNHVKTPVPKPVSHFELSAEITKLLFCALHKEPELRYSHASEIKGILATLNPTATSI